MTEAPKITPADIEAEIATEATFNAGEALVALGIPHHERASLLTICVLTLRNGFNAVGTSSCVSAENFNAEIGAKVARESAIAQVWPVLGYTLLSRLAPGGDLHPDAPPPELDADWFAKATVHHGRDPVPGVYNDDMEGARPASGHPAHVQRMISEYRELTNRWRKLGEFIDSNPAFPRLDPNERDAMTQQLDAMWSYGEALLNRLNRAGVGKEELL